MTELTRNQKKLKRLCEKQGGKCYHCGVIMTAGAFPPIKTTATVDHLLPLSLGGKWAGINEVAACHKCNKKRGHKISPELMSELIAKGHKREIKVKAQYVPESITFGYK